MNEIFIMAGLVESFLIANIAPESVSLPCYIKLTLFDQLIEKKST